MIFLKTYFSVLLVTQVFNNVVYPCDVGIECPCVDYYSPVCAKKGDTTQIFANECVVNNINCESDDGKKGKNNYWHIVADKLCEVDGVCSVLCIDLYLPICAYDGTNYVTFGNDCELYRANCLNPGVWGVYSFGECPPCVSATTT